LRSASESRTGPSVVPFTPQNKKSALYEKPNAPGGDVILHRKTTIATGKEFAVTVAEN